MSADPEDVLLAALAHGDESRLCEVLDEHPELVSTSFEVDEVDGWTPLHIAVRLGRTGPIRALIDHGARLDAETAEHRTPLHVALQYDDSVCSVLIEAGAPVDVPAAAFIDDVDRIEQLLDDLPKLAWDRRTGLSPLAWAALGGAADAAALLIARGASLNAGQLACAASSGSAAVTRVLLAAGSDPNARDEAERTALHHAAALELTDDADEVAELLLAAGADREALDAAGLTPLDVALDGCLGPRRAHFERIAALLSEWEPEWR